MNRKEFLVLAFGGSFAAALSKETKEERTKSWRTRLEKGVYSVNKIRAWYNLNPIEGGDTYKVEIFADLHAF